MYLSGDVIIGWASEGYHGYSFIGKTKIYHRAVGVIKQNLTAYVKQAGVRAGVKIV